MRIRDELFGKEVLDAEIQIVGKVHDVVLDKDTYEITDLVIKGSGLPSRLKQVKTLFQWNL